MSLILQSFVSATGGILAGLALAGGLLFRQHQALITARYQASHDDTTGLPNRRAFLARLRHALHTGRPIGVVLLDLDGFKTVNDTLGHDAGNQVLAEVGRRLSTLDHPVVLAARLSGDEYALLVHGDHDQVATAAYAARLALDSAPVLVGTELLTVTASVGYATAGVGTSPRQLLHQADVAMYAAKRTHTAVYGAPVWTSGAEVATHRRCRDRRTH